ncbi:MAG: ABC transporter substrate-binding protein [Actinomycetota bacterium]
MKRPLTLRLVALIAALALIAAACGGDDDDATTAGASTGSGSGSASEPAEEPEAEPATEESDQPAEEPAEAPAADALTISHKFGDAVIEGTPERVITIGFSEQDPVLALGVVPIAVREWFGGYDHAAWPWAQDELGSGTPEVFDMVYGELSYEAIAVLTPDLIVATHAGITQEEYDILAEIAPTIAEPAETASFGMAWQDQTRMIGEALGLSDEADQAVTLVQAAVLDAARANDDFGGATFAWANPTESGTFWVVGQSTPPMQFLQELGLVYPDEIAEIVGDLDSFEMSAEQFALLDVDVLIVRADGNAQELMMAEPLFAQMPVMAENRVIWLESTDPIYGALSFSTILSIDYLVDELVPLIASVVAGDDGGADEDPAAAAAAEAFRLVYDSAAAWEDKAPHLENADALQASNEAYMAGADGVGGIGLEPTNVVVEGDTATVTYNVLFGENPAYSDLTRTISLVDGVWVVSEADYCDFLASARTPCG